MNRRRIHRQYALGSSGDVIEDILNRVARNIPGSLSVASGILNDLSDKLETLNLELFANAIIFCLKLQPDITDIETLSSDKKGIEQLKKMVATYKIHPTDSITVVCYMGMIFNVIEKRGKAVKHIQFVEIDDEEDDDYYEGY